MSDLSQLSNDQLLALSATSAPVAPSPGTVYAQTTPAVQGVNSFGQPLASPSYNQGIDLTALTPEQLQQLQANSDPNMSSVEDVGRSLTTGLARGLSGIGAIPADIINLSGSVLHRGYGALQDLTGSNLGVPYMGAKNTNFVEPNFAHVNGLPTQADVDVARQRLVGPDHAPQTKAGDYAERIGEFAPGAALGGEGLIGRVASVVLPAVASQAAQDAAPQPYKTAAALAGSLAGGGLAAGASSFARSPQAALGAAAGDLDGATIQQAQQLRVNAAAQGLNLTLPEAVQQVTNNGTGLGRLQRVIEGTKQGQAATAPYFAARPAQVRNAVTALADQLAAPSAAPGMVGQAAQDAANTALDRARQVVNRVAEPDYAALRGQEMDPEQYQTLAADPSYAGALADLRGHPELGAVVAGLPDNNLAVVNEVQKRLGTLADQARGTPMMPGDNHLGALRTNAQVMADMLARDASDNGYGGEYGNARDVVQNLSAQYVDPLRAGPLGTISRTNNVGTQAAALYPSVAAEGAPGETSQAVRVLNATAPGVADGLTRQHLVNNLNEALSQLQGGQNQYAGAKLAVALAGNPEQQAALQAGLSELPQGAERSQQMADLLEALRATGKRQPPGSMTAFNASDLKDLHIAPVAQALGRIGDPLTWGAGIGDVINRANYRRNVNQLVAAILAAPEDTAAVLGGARAANRANVSPLLPALLAAPQTGTRQ